MLKTTSVYDQELISWLGAPALLPEEDGVKFHQLADLIREEFGLKDVISALLINDLTMIFWEVRRLKEYKTARLISMSYLGLDSLLEICGTDSATRRRLREGWARNDAKIRREVHALLRQFKLDASAVSAETFVNDMETHLAIDQMIAKAEQRRRAIFRDYVVYRDDLEVRLQRVERAMDEQEKAPPESTQPRQRVRHTPPADIVG